MSRMENGTASAPNPMTVSEDTDRYLILISRWRGLEITTEHSGILTLRSQEKSLCSIPLRIQSEGFWNSNRHRKQVL
jgi:hypothetical protein